MRGHAIVLGGSLAGFCCGRALSRFFEKVTLIERDDIPLGVGARAGVPQARHAHVILDRGRRELERMFPGFERKVRDQGAIIIDPGLEFATLGAAGWSPRLPTDARTIFASRDLTDAIVRELTTAATPNLDVRARTELVDVKVERRGAARISSIEIRNRDGGATESMTADLIVDASGRGSKLPGILKHAGVALPEETVVDSGTWYSTRWFKAKPGHELPPSAWWKAALLVPTLAGPGALLIPVEGDRWVVSIATIGRGQPKVDEDNFETKLRELPSPIIAEAVGEPISPVYGSRATPNRLHHFERWTDPVGGFIAVGDAVCAFNPIQGQGISSTAVCASILQRCLEDTRADLAALPARFFKAQAKWVAEPWGLATSFDLRFPTTQGKRPLAPKLFAPYIKLMALAARDDISLLRQISDVGQLNQPVASLLSGPVVKRVIGATVRRSLGRTRGRPAPSVTAYPPQTIIAAS